MVDPKATEIEICISGRDFTIKQSPGVLQSNRTGGTTGAAVWRTSLHFAEWLASPRNQLFECGLLNHESTVLELGSGISGHVVSTLGERVKKVVATDQQYAVNLLQVNVNANLPPPKRTLSSKTKGKSSGTNIEVCTLDWETDDISSFFRTNGLGAGVDVVVVCDCVFNYALIKPLVQTCSEIGNLQTRSNVSSESAKKPTVYVIAQQLRQPEVFELWLQVFMQRFRVWRIPRLDQKNGLVDSTGFVVHVGIPREDTSTQH